MTGTRHRTMTSVRSRGFFRRLTWSELLLCGVLAAIAVRLAGPSVVAQDPPASEKSSTAKASGPSAATKTTTRPAVKEPVRAKSGGAAVTPLVPEPKQFGGEPAGVVQVANLIYAGVKSSHCFSDHFLVAAEKDSAISTSRRFHAVKLSSEELFNFPLVIMTGEGAFELLAAERENLRLYVERGGFLLASAGCSSPDWDRSFRREMSLVFPQHPLSSLGMDHTVFQTVHEIKELKANHGTARPLDGVSMAGRLGVVYSQDGLNDTAHTQGCCCCGGNEITNCIEINVNILAYSLLY